MDKEKQEHLFTKYPALFRQKDLSPTYTCMCWGIETGNGWYDLIDRTCQKIQSVAERLKVTVEFSQVKEKYGSLRLYVDVVEGVDIADANNEVMEIVNAAEQESENICYTCGKPAVMQSIHGWLTPVCDDCLSKKN